MLCYLAIYGGACVAATALYVTIAPRLVRIVHALQQRPFDARQQRWEDFGEGAGGGHAEPTRTAGL